MILALVALAGLLGLGIGSFANVVIYRVPAGKSVVAPRSACPRCGTPIKNRHNVPVIGWLVLRGRCAACREPISARYPIIEALVGTGFAAIVWWSGVRWQTLLLLVFFAFGVMLAAIDFEVRRLPNVLVAGLSGSAAVIVLVAGVATGDGGLLVRVALAAAAVGAFYVAAFVAYPAGMGIGDVKLAPVVGAVLGVWGWPAVLVGVFAGFLWGALAGIVAMTRSRAVRRVKIPFGPFMLAGAWTGLLWAQPVWDWYTGLVFPS